MAFVEQNSEPRQKIIMVTGKGGVGKSTVAAAIAQKQAKAGFRTLLVELGEQSYFQYVYGQPVGYEPKSFAPNFSICMWSGEACLRDYVYYFVKVRKIVDLFFDNRVMRTFIRAAPALKELAVLGKITSGIRHWGPNLDYDVLVVDAFATGHFLALLRAPIGMGELIESGPMGEQSRSIDKVLRDPKLCEYTVVTLPEELPTTETEELVVELKGLMGQESKVYCNRVYASPLSAQDLEKIQETDPAQKKNEFIDFLKNLIMRQSTQLEKLKANVPQTKILPLILSSSGRDVIDKIEAALP